MKLRLTCKEAVDLMISGEDRPLGRGQRFVLWCHLLVCHACPRFHRQILLMRAALRRWREQPPGL